MSNSSLDVKVFSNCDKVALYLNDSIVSIHKSESDLYSSHLDFPTYTFSLSKFETGALVAKGYLNGSVVCEDKISTPRKAEKLKLEIDESGIDISKVDQDILIIHASVIDDNGTTVVNDSSQVQFIIEKGNAVLIGENPATEKAGIASILLKTENTNEDIFIIAASEELENNQLIITVIRVKI